MPSVSSPLSPRGQAQETSSPTRRRAPLPARQPAKNNPAAHLRLPSLPRFHPANFASSQNLSQTASPVAGSNSPQTSASPRTTHNRQYEVQRQMYQYQQQLLANSARQVRGSGAKPNSPRLAPLASPGAVTPLELEDEADGYLTAGIDTAEADEHIERLIRKEARRRGEHCSRRISAISGT